MYYNTLLISYTILCVQRALAARRVPPRPAAGGAAAHQLLLPALLEEGAY